MSTTTKISLIAYDRFLILLEHSPKKAESPSSFDPVLMLMSSEPPKQKLNVTHFNAECRSRRDDVIGHVYNIPEDDDEVRVCVCVCVCVCVYVYMCL